MATVNVYERYYKAKAEANGRKRHAALVALISDSEAGQIKYEAAVNFFPHDSEDDFAVSYDAYFAKELYAGKGRRSKKREAKLLETFREEIDALAAEAGGTVFWDEPLREERRG